MQHGICLLSIVPVRKEAGSTSEMVTQLLFGETYSIIDSTVDWLKIKIEFDAYEGWLNIKQHTSIQYSTFQLIQKENYLLSNELVQIIHNKNEGLSFPICIGSTLPVIKNGQITIENHGFEFSGTLQNSHLKKTANEIIQTSLLFLNAPYLWGGKSPFGIDCSGFTQVVFKLNGYKLPRDASQQVNKGYPLSFVEEAEAGDLAFFDNEEGNIVHVGIMLDKHRIIHASGNVRIDRIDHYGIFNESVKKYSHHLRVIKRIL